MLKGAMLDDIPQIMALGKLFLNESNIKNKKFDYDTTYNAIYYHIMRDDSLVLVYEIDNLIRGFFACTVDIYPFNSDRVATDLYTFVHPNYRHRGIGIRFWKYYINWAKNKLCTEIIIGNMSTIAGNEIERIVKKLGFIDRGKSYTMDLT